MLSSRKFWLGLVISAAFLGMFFWRVDIGETLDALAGANYWWLIPAVGMYFIAVFFRSLRWHYLLLPMKRIPGRRLFAIVVVGYMANNLLPVRLGELVRAWFVGHKEGVSTSGALATIMIERVFDGAFLLLLALLVWPFLPVADLLSDFAESSGIPKGWLVLIVSTPFVVALGIFFVIALVPSLGRRLVRFLLVFVPRRFERPVEKLAIGFVDGLAALRSPKRVIATVLLTVPVWMAEGTMYFMVAQGFAMHQSFHALLLVMATSNLATSVPSSAGGVGPFEWATRLTVEAYAVSREVAAAYAIVLHVALLVPVTLLGLFLLWLDNMSLREVARDSSLVMSDGFEPQKVRKVSQ